MTRFYRTIVQIEILSNEEVPNPIDLEAINYEIIDGSWSGRLSIISSEEVTRARMAELLIGQGSDPEFLDAS